MSLTTLGTSAIAHDGNSVLATRAVIRKIFTIGMQPGKETNKSVNAELDKCYVISIRMILLLPDVDKKTKDSHGDRFFQT